MILVRRPIHAVGNRAVLDTCWRPCATRAAFINYGNNVRLALALRRRAGRLRLVLDDRAFLKFLYARSAVRHEEPPGNQLPTADVCILADAGRVVNVLDRAHFLVFNYFWQW